MRPLQRRGWDVFDVETGRYLGALESPVKLRMPVFLEDAVLTVHEDEAGTIRVKRYRLVLPDVPDDGDDPS